MTPERKARAAAGADVTRSEWLVLDLLAEGLPVKQIAARRGVLPSTVSHQLQELREKLDLNSNLQLVVWYYKDKMDRAMETNPL